jgi:hypothetical protein
LVAPEPADWAPEPAGYFAPKPTYGARKPTYGLVPSYGSPAIVNHGYAMMEPFMQRPLNLEVFRGPGAAPADTYGSQVETPARRPSPRCVFFGIHEGKKSKKCGKCGESKVRYLSYISKKKTWYTWVGPYRIGQKTQRSLF